MRRAFWFSAQVTILLFLATGDLSAKTLPVGTDPTAPFTTIQAAIEAASAGDVVLVADGTYSGTGNRDLDFRGKAITVRSANGPERCLIDGQGQARGVLFQSGEKADSVLEGFTIVNGRADRGAGIHCSNMSSPTIAHCILRGNEATQGGGGMYISASSPALTGCRFLANKATIHQVCDDEGCRVTRARGGAILSQSSRPTIADCNFSDNLAADRGGAVCNVFSVASLANCTFTANDANDNGGAVCNTEGGTLLLVDCSFDQNAADQDGGALSATGSTTTVQRSTFTGCRTRADDGGAIRNLQGVLTLDHCVFQGNWGAEDGGALADFDSNSVVTDCVFAGNGAGEDGGAVYAWQTSLALTGCTLTENTARDDGGALYHRAIKWASLTGCYFTANSARDNGGGIFNRYGASPQLRHCVFSGNLARSSGAAIYNRDDSHPRLTNCLFFDNAAGDSGGAVCNRNDSSPTLTNCTFSANAATFECGGVLSWDNCRPVLTNCILWDNTSDEGTTEQAQILGGTPEIRFCCIQSYSRILADSGNLAQNPLFVAGPLGDYYLSRQAAGQTTTSPACDAGTSPPAAADFAGFTTRTDEADDSDPLDMGYHYPVSIPVDPDSGSAG